MYQTFYDKKDIKLSCSCQSFPLALDFTVFTVVPAGEISRDAIKPHPATQTSTLVTALPNLLLQMEMGLKLGLCATLLPPSSASVHLIVHMAVLDSTLQGVQ